MSDLLIALNLMPLDVRVRSCCHPSSTIRKHPRYRMDAAKELIVFNESEGKLLVQQYDDDFDKWIDIDDAFVVTC